MLDLKFLRTNLDDIASRLAVKGFELDREAFAALDAERKNSDVQTQDLLAKRKQASKKIGELVQSGKSVDEAKEEVNETLALIDDSLAGLKAGAAANEAAMKQFLLELPNIPDVVVPEGADEADNVEVSIWGEKPSLEGEPGDHVAVAENLGGLQVEPAALMSGARFAVLNAGVARLHRALSQFMLDLHTMEHGYTEVNVPLLVNSDALTGTGQLPKFEEDLFRVDTDPPLYLIPTAEVPVTNLVRDRILGADELPLKLVAHTPCFRSEAGSHGRDTRGLIRQHQFEKVELVQVVRPEDSEEALESLTGHAETILQRLDLAYRKVLLCGGDLSFSSARTYDLEVWLPGQSCYREISSCSNFREFQARRMLARWRNPETGKPEPVHTINGSGLAVGRTLVAILENYQNTDGSVTVPEVLRGYMNGLERLK